MPILSNTVTTRWGRAADATLPLIAVGIPAHTVRARIAAQQVAVAETGGEAIGALQLEYLWGTRPYMAMIRVAPEWQRRGVGRALLAFVEQSLQRAGHQELLSSSQANEPEPQAWHRHMGFAECGALSGINEGGIDEIFFRKLLASTPSTAAITTAQPNER